MSTHNICFRREIRKILCGYLFLSVAMSGHFKLMNYHPAPQHSLTRAFTVHLQNYLTCIPPAINRPDSLLHNTTLVIPNISTKFQNPRYMYIGS